MRIEHNIPSRRRPERPADISSARKVVYAAIVANVAIAISKFVAAGITGSAAMLAEGVHSAVDTGNEFLLLLGMKHSEKPPDEWHPFGYGKVLYFWALIVALSVFSLGGGISIYHGVLALRNPPPLEDPTWNYVVLAVAALFEGYSWYKSRKELNERRQPHERLWHTVRRSKDASVFTVFIEDSAALIGIAVAASGIWLGQRFHNPYIDPAASVIVGLVLVAAAFSLARETGGLLVGESIDRGQIVKLKKIISSEPAVEKVGHLLTMQLGPDQVLLTAAVRFRHGLGIDEVEQAIQRMESAITNEYPSVRRIFLEASAFRSTASR
ncbi:MAG TPA: cation diffusion facilitator family transporter [Noviherbaspirillum sp.]|nr:cation diffusion facilitator family transporter [Noviherbaspirillum sp.]